MTNEPDSLLLACTSEFLEMRIASYNSLTQKLATSQDSVIGSNLDYENSKKIIANMKSDISHENRDVRYAAIGFFGCYLANERLMDLLNVEDEQQLLDILLDFLNNDADPQLLTRGLWSLAQSKFGCDIYCLNLSRIMNLLLGILSNNPDSFTICECLEAMKSLIESTPEEILSSSAIWYPKILPYMFYNDQKIREVTYCCFSICRQLNQRNPDLVKLHENILPFIPELKTVFSKKMLEFFDEECPVVLKIWRLLVILIADELHSGTALINTLLEVVERAFKSPKSEYRVEAFKCWNILISNFSLDPKVLVHPKRLKLLMSPLKANNSKTEEIAHIKLLTWWFLVGQVGDKITEHFDLIIVPLLKFSFNPNLSTGERFNVLAGGFCPCIRYPNLIMKTAEVLAKILTDCQEIQLPEYKFFLTDLRNSVINSSILQKHYQLIFRCLEIVFTTLEAMDEKQKHLGYIILLGIMKHIIVFVKKNLNKKETVDMVKELFTTFSTIENQCSPGSSLSIFIYKLLELASIGDYALPRSVMTSRLYHIPTGTKVSHLMNGTLSNFFIHKLCRPSFLHFANKTEFLTLWEAVIGKCKPSDKLFFIEAVIEELKGAIPYLCPKYVEVLVSLWSATARFLDSHIEETHLINQGDNSEHDWSCIYSTLLFPIGSYHDYLSSLETKSYQNLLNIWMTIWKHFSALTLFTTTAEANSEAEFITRKMIAIVNQSLNESSKTELDLTFYADSLSVIVEEFKFTDFGKKAKRSVRSPVRPKKRPQLLQNLGGIIELTNILMQKALANSSPCLSCTFRQLCITASRIFENIPQSQMVWPLLQGFTDNFCSALQVHLSTRFGNEVERKFVEMWSSFCSMLENHIGLDISQDQLALLAPILVAALKSSVPGIKQRTSLLWSNALSSVPHSLPQSLKEALRTPLVLPLSETIYEFSESKNKLSTSPSPASKKLLNLKENASDWPEMRVSHWLRGKNAKMRNAKPVCVDDMNEQDFVKVNSPKTRRRILTPHQIDKMKSRGRDIPALYNDTSQTLSHFTSQESYESCLTSKCESALETGSFILETLNDKLLEGSQEKVIEDNNSNPGSGVTKNRTVVIETQVEETEPLKKVKRKARLNRRKSETPKRKSIEDVRNILKGCSKSLYVENPDPKHSKDSKNKLPSPDEIPNSQIQGTNTITLHRPRRIKRSCRYDDSIYVTPIKTPKVDSPLRKKSMEEFVEDAVEVSSSSKASSQDKLDDDPINHEAEEQGEKTITELSSEDDSAVITVLSITPEIAQSSRDLEESNISENFSAVSSDDATNFGTVGDECHKKECNLSVRRSPSSTPSKVTRSGRRIVAPNKDMPEPMTPSKRMLSRSSSETSSVLSCSPSTDSHGRNRIHSKSLSPECEIPPNKRICHNSDEMKAMYHLMQKRKDPIHPKTQKGKHSRHPEAQNGKDLANHQPQKRKSSLDLEAQNEKDPTHLQTQKRKCSRDLETQNEEDPTHFQPQKRKSSKNLDAQNGKDPNHLQSQKRKSSRDLEAQNEKDPTHLQTQKRKSSRDLETQNEEDPTHHQPQKRKSSRDLETQNEKDPTHHQPQKRKSSLDLETQNEKDPTHHQPQKRKSSLDLESQNEEDPTHLQPQKRRSSKNLDAQNWKDPNHLQSQKRKSSRNLDAQNEKDPSHLPTQKRKSSRNLDAQNEKDPTYLQAQKRKSPKNLDAQTGKDPSHLPTQKRKSSRDLEAQNEKDPTRLQAQKRKSPKNLDAQTGKDPSHLLTQKRKSSRDLEAQNEKDPTHLQVQKRKSSRLLDAHNENDSAHPKTQVQNLKDILHSQPHNIIDTSHPHAQSTIPQAQNGKDAMQEEHHELKAQFRAVNGQSFLGLDTLDTVQLPPTSILPNSVSTEVNHSYFKAKSPKKSTNHKIISDDGIDSTANNSFDHGKGSRMASLEVPFTVRRYSEFRRKITQVLRQNVRNRVHNEVGNEKSYQKETAHTNEIGKGVVNNNEVCNESANRNEFPCGVGMEIDPSHGKRTANENEVGKEVPNEIEIEKEASNGNEIASDTEIGKEASNRNEISNDIEFGKLASNETEVEKEVPNGNEIANEIKIGKEYSSTNDVGKKAPENRMDASELQKSKNYATNVVFPDANAKRSVDLVRGTKIRTRNYRIKRKTQMSTNETNSQTSTDEGASRYSTGKLTESNKETYNSHEVESAEQTVLSLDGNSVSEVSEVTQGQTAHAQNSLNEAIAKFKQPFNLSQRKEAMEISVESLELPDGCHISKPLEERCSINDFSDSLVNIVICEDVCHKESLITERTNVFEHKDSANVCISESAEGSIDMRKTRKLETKEIEDLETTQIGELGNHCILPTTIEELNKSSILPTRSPELEEKSDNSEDIEEIVRIPAEDKMVSGEYENLAEVESDRLLLKNINSSEVNENAQPLSQTNIQDTVLSLSKDSVEDITSEVEKNESISSLGASATGCSEGETLVSHNVEAFPEEVLGIECSNVTFPPKVSLPLIDSELECIPLRPDASTKDILKFIKRVKKVTFGEKMRFPKDSLWLGEQVKLKEKEPLDCRSPEKEGSSALANSISTPERKMLTIGKSPVPQSRATIMLACAKRTLKAKGEDTVLLDCSSPLQVTPTNSPPCKKNRFNDLNFTGDAKPWAKHEPSPGASPCGSILKKKGHEDDNVNCTPLDAHESGEASPSCSKNRRVSFADPPVSESVEIPPSPKALKGIRAQKKLDMMQETFSPECFVFSCDSQENFSLTFNPLNCSQPFFPPLVDCLDPVELIAPYLTSPSLVDALIEFLKDRGLRTVGDFCRITERDIHNLPIQAPKSLNTLKYLRKYEEMKELRNRVSSAKNSDLATSIRNCSNKSYESSKNSELATSISNAPFVGRNCSSQSDESANNIGSNNKAEEIKQVYDVNCIRNMCQILEENNEACKALISGLTGKAIERLFNVLTELMPYNDVIDLFYSYLKSKDTFK